MQILPNQTIYFETIHHQISRYFLDYIMSYRKNFIIISKRQNGVSTLINKKIQTILQRNKSQIIKIANYNDGENSGIFEVKY